MLLKRNRTKKFFEEKNKDQKADNASEQHKQLYCSFCGKSADEVHKLIAGPGVYICNECTDLCVEIIAEDLPENQDLLQRLEGDYVYELLNSHFSSKSPDKLTSFSFTMPGEFKLHIEKAIKEWLIEDKIRFKYIGIGETLFSDHAGLTFSELWEQRNFPVPVGVRQYCLQGINTQEEKPYLKNGLWFCISEVMTFVLLFNCRKIGGEDVLFFETASLTDNGDCLVEVAKKIHGRITAADSV